MSNSTANDSCITKIIINVTFVNVSSFIVFFIIVLTELSFTSKLANIYAL